MENLDKFLPTKTLKLKPGDKPFITAELKTLKRQRQREYCKRKVKTEKYFQLLNEFKAKYKKAAQDHLKKKERRTDDCQPSSGF